MGKTHRYERGGVKKPKFDRKKKSRVFSEEDEEDQFDPIHKNDDPIKELWGEVVDHESNKL